MLIGALLCQWTSQVGQTAEVKERKTSSPLFLRIATNLDLLSLFGRMRVAVDLHLSIRRAQISEIRGKISVDGFVRRLSLVGVDLRLDISSSSFRSIDWYILRYFGLNALFFFTFTMIYSGVCATVESLGLNFTPDPSLLPSLHPYTTIGLLLVLLVVLLYGLVDLCIYKKEFRTIWTPYIFLGYVLVGPPWRRSSSTNEFLLWSIVVVVSVLLVVRLCRLTKRAATKKKIRINSHIEQICS